MIKNWLDEIERRAQAIGKTLEDVVLQAGVSPVTLWRWKTGKSGIASDTIQKVDNAIDLMELEADDVSREAANG